MCQLHNLLVETYRLHISLCNENSCADIQISVTIRIEALRSRMGEERGVHRVLVGKPEGKNHWGNLGVDGWIVLGCISRRRDVGIWTGLGWPRIETGGGRL